MSIVVLHICDYAAPYRGNFINSLCSLETYGDIKNIYLFPYRAKNNNAKEWIRDINVSHEVAYTQDKNWIKNILLVIKIIKKHKVDYIFRHFYDIKIDIILKILFCGRRTIRFFHCMYINDPKTIWRNSLRGFVWKHNIFVGVSSAVSKSLKTFFPNFLVYTIDNAIDFKRLNSITSSKTEDKIVLMTMGYDIQVKGVDIAIQAANKLQQKYNISLKIVAPSNKNKLISYINEHFEEFPDWIELLPPTSNISDYYNDMDIFLSPSRTEAFGYAVVEAAYFKKSIVASKVGGQGELNIDSVYWFENERVEELIAKIEQAIQELNDEAKVLQKDKTAESIQKIYSLERWVKDVVNILTKDNK